MKILLTSNSTVTLPSMHIIVKEREEHFMNGSLLKLVACTIMYFSFRPGSDLVSVGTATPGKSGETTRSPTSSAANTVSKASFSMDIRPNTF